MLSPAPSSNHIANNHLPRSLAGPAASLLRYYGIDDDVRSCRENIESLILLSQQTDRLPPNLTPYWEAGRLNLESQQPSPLVRFRLMEQDHPM